VSAPARVRHLDRIVDFRYLGADGPELLNAPG
jgi:hypothetical protein